VHQSRLFINSCKHGKSTESTRKDNYLCCQTLELHAGFWAAYLLPLCSIYICILLLIFGRSIYLVRPPQQTVLTNTYYALLLGAKSKFKMDAAKPSWQQAHGNYHVVTGWNDQFVNELKRSLIACRILEVSHINSKRACE
jgi:hypothetical protein